MIYSKNLKFKKYLFKNKKSFVTFLQQLDSYINNVNNTNIQYEIELVNDDYSMEFNSFDTLIKTINTSNIIYYLKIFLTADKSQIFNKIEFVYHNIDGFKNKTNIKLYSKDINWLKNTEQEILESLEDKKNLFRFINNDFISILLVILISTFFLIINPDFTINFSDISDLLSFLILYGIILFVYEIMVMLAIPTFKIKWNLPLNPIKRYVYDKIADNIINYIISAIIGGIFSLIIARIFL